MRHRVVTRKLASDRDHMRSLLNNLSTELILREKIETTLAKAKMLRPHIERLVTYASASIKSKNKIKKFNAVKELSRKITSGLATRKLLEDIATRYASTPGGYTRIIRTGTRQGDQAVMARIEFTKAAAAKEAKKAAKTTKKAKVATENESNE